MAVISSLPVTAMPPPSSRAPQAGQAGFAVPLPAAVQDVSPRLVQASMAAAIGSSMLAMQEQAGRDEANKDGRRHGQRMLDALTRLQHALLSGGDVVSLAALAELTRTDLGPIDPALGSALSSIRLRARIELERGLRREEPCRGPV